MLIPRLDPGANSADVDRAIAEALRTVGMEGTDLAAIFELGFRMGAQVAAEAARPPRAWR